MKPNLNVGMFLANPLQAIPAMHNKGPINRAFTRRDESEVPQLGKRLPAYVAPELQSLHVVSSFRFTAYFSQVSLIFIHPSSVCGGCL